MKSFSRFSHIKLNMFLTVLTLREALSDVFTFKRERGWADPGSLSPLSCCKVVVKEETQVLLFSSDI